MAKDEFFLSVRTAVGFLLPRVDANLPEAGSGDLERALRGATIWLTPGAVKGFDRRDFDDVDPAKLDLLERNVGRFLEIAREVAPKGPATSDQVESALPPFLAIVRFVRENLLDDWRNSANALLDQAEDWATGEGWPTKRYPWAIAERFLGTYELARFVFAVDGSQMALLPLGLLASGSQGAFDLAVMPAFESVVVAQGKNRKWSIRPLPGETASRPWTRTAFVEVSRKLARMG